MLLYGVLTPHTCEYWLLTDCPLYVSACGMSEQITLISNSQSYRLTYFTLTSPCVLYNFLLQPVTSSMRLEKILHEQFLAVHVVDDLDNLCGPPACTGQVKPFFTYRQPVFSLGFRCTNYRKITS